MSFDDTKVRETLERLLYPEYACEPQRNALQRLTHLCRLWVQRLRHDAGEPVIWTYRTSSGETLWNAYDPSSGWSIFGVPQFQVWAWLAERYRRRPIHPS